MKHSDKMKLVEALEQIGLSSREARNAMLAFALAMTPPKRILVVDDFSGLTNSVIVELKSEEQRRCALSYYDRDNHPDGWYRKFEKKSGKRNLKL